MPDKSCHLFNAAEIMLFNLNLNQPVWTGTRLVYQCFRKTFTYFHFFSTLPLPDRSRYATRGWGCPLLWHLWWRCSGAFINDVTLTTFYLRAVIYEWSLLKTAIFIAKGEKDQFWIKFLLYWWMAPYLSDIWNKLE